MDGACFGPTQLTIVTGLLGVMATAIGILHRALIGAKDAQITDLQDRLDRALNVTEQGQVVTREAVRSSSRRRSG